MKLFNGISHDIDNLKHSLKNYWFALNYSDSVKQHAIITVCYTLVVVGTILIAGR